MENQDYLSIDENLEKLEKLLTKLERAIKELKNAKNEEERKNANSEYLLAIDALFNLISYFKNQQSLDNIQNKSREEVPEDLNMTMEGLEPMEDWSMSEEELEELEQFCLETGMSQDMGLSR